MINASTIRLNRIFLLLSALLCLQGMTAQTSFTDFFKKQSDDSTKMRLIHNLEMDFRPGFIFQTHDFFRGDNYDMQPIRTSLSASLKYGFSQPENSAATAAFGKSAQGIGIAYNSFLEPSAIGNPVAVFAYQSAPVWNISPAVTLDYEWNFGVSFGWNPYDETANPKNHIIGTKINAYLNAGINLDWRLSQNIGLLTGVTFSHYSNGNTGIPNCGLNTAAVNLGIAYKFGKNRSDATEASAPEFTRHISYDIVMFGSFRRKGIDTGNGILISGDRYPVAGFNFNPMYNVCYRFRTGLSLDATYDASAGLSYEAPICDLGGNCGEPEMILSPVKDRFSLGVSARAEYVMPYFSINAGIGYNFLSGSSDQRSLYQILALKMAITRSAYIHIGYCLRDFKDPNYLMLGIGFRLHDLAPRLF